MSWRRWQSIVLLGLLAAVAHAQPATQPAPRIKAHLMTFSPGRLVWERFGHNAIFITDVAAGQTYAYDFGNFDFNDADFIWRFVRGNMRYWGERKDAVEMLDIYSRDNRQIWSQQINLPDDKLMQLWKNLEQNVSGENKYYTYNYYTDNCSTRLRDHIDRVTGGALRKQMTAIPAEHTFRWHTRVGMESAPLLAAGVDFATAEFVDHKLTAWDAAFTPAELMFYIQRVTTVDGGRIVGPATERNIYLEKEKMVTLPAQPPVRWPYYAGFGAALGVLFALCGVGGEAARASRYFAAIIWCLWGLLAGIAGLLLVFFWVFTNHVAAYANENLFQVAPIAIGWVILGPLAAFGRTRKIARWLAIACAAAAVLGVVLKLLPWLRQDNWRTVALALPAQVGLLIGVWLRTREHWDAERVRRQFAREYAR